MGVLYGGLVGYCWKVTDVPDFTEVNNTAASCVLRLGFVELHNILDERPDGK